MLKYLPRAATASSGLCEIERSFGDSDQNWNFQAYYQQLFVAKHPQPEALLVSRGADKPLY